MGRFQILSQRCNQRVVRELFFPSLFVLIDFIDMDVVFLSAPFLQVGNLLTGLKGQSYKG